MSRREDIDNGLWGDPDFEELSADAKLLYLWSFTNPLCNMAGLYKVSTTRMGADCSLSPVRVENALRELAEGGFAFHEKAVLWVRSRVKHLRTKAPTMARSIVGSVDGIDPGHPLRRQFLEKYVSLSWLDGALDGLAAQSRSTKPNTDTPSIGSMEPQEGFQGRATAGQGKEVPTTATSQGEADDFAEWLAHHEETTGRKPPKPGTKARGDVAASFVARRAEGYSLVELKLATDGAVGDKHRRENGYVGCESVLRPKKVHDLVEAGRQRKPPTPKDQQRNCLDCSKPISAFNFTNRDRRCDEHADAYSERVLGEAAA